MRYGMPLRFDVYTKKICILWIVLCTRSNCEPIKLGVSGFGELGSVVIATIYLTVNYVLVAVGKTF